MEQNNFENELRKKLNEMKLVPPERVWSGVEKHLDKKDRRRKLLFIFLLLGMVFISGIYLYHKKESWQNTDANKSLGINKLIDKPIKEDKTTAAQKSSNSPAVKSKWEIKGSLSKENSDIKGLQKSIAIRNRFIALEKQQSQIQLSDTIRKNADRNESILSNKSSDSINNEVAFTNKKKNIDIIILSPTGVLQKSNKVSERKVNHSGLNQTEINSDSIEEYSHGNTNKEKKNKSYQWNWGLNFSGGISSIISNASIAKSYSNTASGPITNPGGRISYPPSAIGNSKGLSAGIVVEKKLTNRLKFSTGLNYKYYSLSNEVGRRASGGAQSSTFNSGNFYLNAAISQPQHYSNQFHFIEIPVSFSLKLNKGNKLPLNFEIGANLMRLLATNALQYEDSSSVYYKDNSFFHKTQSGLHTGFSFTLFAQQRFPVNIGPFFEYNFTPFANKGLYQNKRMNYFGLKASVLF